jgi:hypothetical protein
MLLSCRILGGGADTVGYAQPRKPFSVTNPTKTPPVEAELPKIPAAQPERAKSAAVAPLNASSETRTKSLVAAVMLSNVGYSNGLRFSNLGGRREIFIPLPQGIELTVAELVLAFDDVSAHEARRSLEILVNDRAVSSIALDGKSTRREVRIPLASAVAREGFLKLSFLYSGAATQDRCIDVRYVGDSLTVRPETAVEFKIGTTGPPNITATAVLMPQNVAILLSNPQLTPADLATALTLAPSLNASGRRVTFHQSLERLPELVERDEPRRWSRGLIIVGALDKLAGQLDATLAPVAGTAPVENTLATARIGGVPVLLVSDVASARVGRLIGNPSLAALRDTSAASVGRVAPPTGPTDRISFDELGVVPAQAEVFGRADLTVTIATRTLPIGTRPSRLVLDVMVAPDGAGEKAVVSTFVNERLLASTVAAIGQPTRLDFGLPDGLVGTVANIRVVIQRRSAQGDCRFEPQGYPAEVLGSSTIILSAAGSVPENFSDLTTMWAAGVEVLIPAPAAERPLLVLGLLSDVLNALSKETAPIIVKFVEAGAVPAPTAPFVAVSTLPPLGATPRVQFNRGRVAIADRAGRIRLDIGGLTTGAVAQIVTSEAHPGLWIKPLTSDGSLPASSDVSLDRGDAAFLDKTGVALAMSTERDTLLQISYSDQESWLTIAERFRSWIVGGLWVLATFVFLFVLQRVYRRRRAARAGMTGE